MGASGARLARMTPRFNPDVNSYWMCDIGRFDYHWIEGDDRLQRPLVKEKDTLEPASWSQALGTVAERVVAGGGPAALRFVDVGARLARRARGARAARRRLQPRGRLGGDLVADAREAAASRDDVQDSAG